MNITVKFSQEDANEAPVNLGVTFAYDSNGVMLSRRYVNLTENLSAQQDTNFIDVSGSNTWHGSQQKESSYTVRLPIMGPYVQVFPYNRAAEERIVSIWGYLVS